MDYGVCYGYLGACYVTDGRIINKRYGQEGKVMADEWTIVERIEKDKIR